MVLRSTYKQSACQRRRLRALELVVLLVAGYSGLRSVPLLGQSRRQDEKTSGASFDALYESGIRFLRAGQADRAIEILTQAADQNTESKAARCSLGQAFITTGRAVEAIGQFRWCAELDPHDVETHYNLGQAYLRLALTTAAKVFQRGKVSPYARRIFAEDYIGKNDLTEAEAQYRLALETEPHAPDLRLALGGLYLRAEKPMQARGEFQKAVDRLPESAVARYRLAEADFLLGDFAPALAELRSVAQLNPQFLRSRADFF